MKTNSYINVTISDGYYSKSFIYINLVNPHTAHKIDISLVPILQMKKLEHREVKSLVWNGTTQEQ